MKQRTRRFLFILLQVPAVVYVIAAVTACSSGWESAEGPFSLLLPPLPLGLIGMAALVVAELWCCLDKRLVHRWRVALVLLNSVGIAAMLIFFFCAAAFYST